MGLPCLRGDQDGWDVWLEIDFGCWHYHRVLRASGEAIWIVAGLLVRFTFMRSLSRALERGLSQFLPGYDTYKNMAEEKLQNKIKILPYTCALIRWQEYWQPGYIVEQDG